MSEHAPRVPVSSDVQIYELTLAEFPLFIFSSAPKEVKDNPFYKYKDQIRGKDGPVERVWTLYRDPKYGFPNESTLSTLYEIIQIWKEQGFASPLINFGSYANLIQRKGQKGRPGRKDYDRIKRDLGCLRGVRIEAQNAFWDAMRQQYVDKDFNLFNEITSFKDAPNSRNSRETIIEASQTFFKSIVGSMFVTDVDSDKFHMLPPLAQRLAIYLSKMFKFQKVHKRAVSELASQLPIHAKLYKHKKQTLIRACDAIIEAKIDLLESFSFEEITRHPKSENIVLFSGRQKSINDKNAKPHSQFPKESFEIDQVVDDILSVCKDTRSLGFYRKVAYYMPKDDIYQAISEVKELASYKDSGNINLGAVFTNRIKTFADQRKIDVFRK